MNQPIAEEEVEKAINKQKNGKSPGPDTAIFYKLNKELIKGTLTMVMNRVLERQQVPRSWREANITLIPKEATDIKPPKNYRLISLLNLDYKIFAVILAESLNFFLQIYIAEEQVGFLPGRHITDNIRNLLNMIEYYDKRIDKRVAFFFTNVEKAFDNLNWDFMKLLLKKIESRRTI